MPHQPYHDEPDTTRAGSGLWQGITRDWDYSILLGDTMKWLEDVLRWVDDDLDLAKYILATIAAESRGNPMAAGDGGDSIGLIQINDIHRGNRDPQEFKEWRQNPQNSIRWAVLTNKRRAWVNDRGRPWQTPVWNIAQHRQYLLNQGYKDGAQMATKLLGIMQGSKAEHWHKYGEAWDVIDATLRDAEKPLAAKAVADAMEKRKVKQYAYGQGGRTGKVIRSRKGPRHSEIVRPPGRPTYA